MYQLYRCPVEGCHFAGVAITTLHYGEHGLTKAEVVERYGKPKEERIVSAMVRANNQTDKSYEWKRHKRGQF